MPRQVRIQFEGAVYHVMCRGDRREPIFDDDRDREMFLATLAEACEKTGWRVFAHVLMGNHYHLLIQTPEANLVAGMTWFQGTYTTRYNAKNGKSGHLFGGRYKAVLVEPGSPGYLRTVIDYIHLNPVRAGILRPRRKGAALVPPDLLAYPWSSLRAYAQPPSKRPGWLEATRGLAACDFNDSPRGRRRYVEWLEERAAQEAAGECGLSAIEGQGLQSTLRRGWCFGTQAFRERMLASAKPLLASKSNAPGGNYSGADLREHNERVAAAIIEAGLSALGLRHEDLQSMPKGAEQKALIAWKVRRQTTVPLAWVSEKLSMGATSTVTRCCKQIGERIGKERQLRSLADAIEAGLST